MNRARMLLRGLTIVAVLALGVCILACARRPVEKKKTAPFKTPIEKRDKGGDDLK